MLTKLCLGGKYHPIPGRGSSLVQLLPLSTTELSAFSQLTAELDAMLLRGGYQALYPPTLNPLPPRVGQLNRWAA
jgi:hypothetical protein